MMQAALTSTRRDLTRRTAIAGLCASAGAASAAAAASGAGWPLWAIEAGGRTVYLTGGTPPRPGPWRDSGIEALLLHCGSLWTETNNVARASPASLMQRYGLDSGTTLLERLAPPDRQRIAAAAALTHTPIEQLAHVR